MPSYAYFWAGDGEFLLGVLELVVHWNPCLPHRQYHVGCVFSCWDKELLKHSGLNKTEWVRWKTLGGLGAGWLLLSLCAPVRCSGPRRGFWHPQGDCSHAHFLSSSWEGKEQGESMPSPFMGTVTSGHISLADFPLTRTNLMPTDLCYNLML